MFLFFIFDLEYLIRVQSSKPLHAKRPLILLLVACAQTTIFFAEPCSKNAGETSVILWVAACIHHSAITTKIEVHFGRFCNQMKVRQPIARQDSLQTLIRTSRRLESFLHEAAQNFEVFSNIQDQK
jgi:hypothetical protein